jgi:hypothetical protein
VKQRITRIEVARMLELDEGFLIELERHEIVVPDPEGLYDAVRVERVRLCCTLHRGLGVNFEGLDVVLDLLGAGSRTAGARASSCCGCALSWIDPVNSR